MKKPYQIAACGYRKSQMVGSMSADANPGSINTESRCETPAARFCWPFTPSLSRCARVYPEVGSIRGATDPRARSRWGQTNSGCASLVAVVKTADLWNGNDVSQLGRLHWARFRRLLG
jgi:hypothetical protein